MRTISPKEIKQEPTSQLLTEESSNAGSGFETSKEDRTQQEEKTGNLSTNAKKYTKLKIYERSRSIRKCKKCTNKHKVETMKNKFISRWQRCPHKA